MLWAIPFGYIAYFCLSGNAAINFHSTAHDNITIYILGGLFGFLAIWMVGFTIFAHVKGSYNENEAVEVDRVFNYYCQLCGYRWSLKPGEPQPQVTVRPDLIAAGNQRLEREAAERQRLAEAAYLYELQQKKK